MPPKKPNKAKRPPKGQVAGCGAASIGKVTARGPVRKTTVVPASSRRRKRAQELAVEAAAKAKALKTVPGQLASFVPQEPDGSLSPTRKSERLAAAANSSSTLSLYPSLHSVNEGYNDAPKKLPNSGLSSVLMMCNDKARLAGVTALGPAGNEKKPQGILFQKIKECITSHHEGRISLQMGLLFEATYFTTVASIAAEHNATDHPWVIAEFKPFRMNGLFLVQDPELLPQKKKSSRKETLTEPRKTIHHKNVQGVVKNILLYMKKYYSEWQ